MKPRKLDTRGRSKKAKKKEKSYGKTPLQKVGFHNPNLS